MKKYSLLGALLCTILTSAFIGCKQTESEPAKALYATSEGYFVKDSLTWNRYSPWENTWVTKRFTQYESDANYYYLRKDSEVVRLPKRIDEKVAVQEGNQEWNETAQPIAIYRDCIGTNQWPDVYCYEGGYLAEIDKQTWYRYRQEGDEPVLEMLRVDSVGSNFYLLQGETETLKVMQIGTGIFMDNDTLIYSGQPGDWKSIGRVRVAYGKNRLRAAVNKLIDLLDIMLGEDE